MYAGRNKQELKFYGSYLVGTGVLPHQWEFKTLKDGSVLLCSSKWEAIRVNQYEHNPNVIHQPVDELDFVVRGRLDINGYSLKTDFCVIGHDNLFINAKVNNVRIDGIIRVWVQNGRPEIVSTPFFIQV